MQESLETMLKSQLLQYPVIQRYLGRLIQQRLQLSHPEMGVITGSILDRADELGGASRRDLQRLERDLGLGDSHCRNFEDIFGLKSLPRDSKDADGKILDMLAEVKAFVYLHTGGFQDITYVLQEPSGRSVDYTAKRKDQCYAIEVTRIGLPQAQRKRPVCFVETPTLYGVASNDNTEQLQEVLADALGNKYKQVKEFCQRQVPTYKGMLIITNGRDYFVTRYARRDMDMIPEAVYAALQKAWSTLMQENCGASEHLHHVIVVLGKAPDKVLTYPPLDPDKVIERH